MLKPRILLNQHVHTPIEIRTLRGHVVARYCEACGHNLPLTRWYPAAPPPRDLP